MPQRNQTRKPNPKTNISIILLHMYILYIMQQHKPFAPKTCTKQANTKTQNIFIF